MELQIGYIAKNFPAWAVRPNPTETGFSRSRAFYYFYLKSPELLVFDWQEALFYAYTEYLY